MKPKPRHKACQKKAKTVLRLPDIEFAKAAVLDSLTSTDVQRGYPLRPSPGNTDSERFDNAVRKTFTVSKEEMQRREAEWQRTQNGKKPGPVK
jgi:hypothetical protein